MSMTPPMLVKSFSSSTARTSSFRFKTPYQASLFLGQLTIAENTGLTGVTGTINPGTDGTHGGSANLQMSTALYDNIVNFMNGHQGQGTFVELGYDNLTPTEVICGATQPQAALSLHPSDAALSDKIDSLNANLQTLVNALGNFAPTSPAAPSLSNGATP